MTPAAATMTMPPVRLVLASKSPARLATLRRAGVEPVVVVSAVDEAGVVAEAVRLGGPLTPAEQALLLARAKAEAVAAQLLSSQLAADSAPGATLTLVVGCDSVFELDGRPYGKPRTPQVAFERIKSMSGRTGHLHTGHWVIPLGDFPLREAGPGAIGMPAGSAVQAGVGAIGTTAVTFGQLDDAEIAAYVATGEPLHVAGSFTVDGLGGPYIERIDGDYHNVVGLSLPLLRNLLERLGVPWHQLRAGDESPNR